MNRSDCIWTTCCIDWITVDERRKCWEAFTCKSYCINRLSLAVDINVFYRIIREKNQNIK